MEAATALNRTQNSSGTRVTWAHCAPLMAIVCLDAVAATFQLFHQGGTSMSWYWFFPIWLVIYGEFRNWSLIVAAVLAIAGFFMERRLKRVKAEQLLMLDWVLQRYSVEEGLLYQAEPKNWIFPEVRDKLLTRSKFFGEMDSQLESIVEAAKPEQQEEIEEKKDLET